MKKRISIVIAALLCAFTLFFSGVAPAHAYAPPSDEGGASTQAEEVIWYFRTNHGVEEMRLWSLTYQRWLTDWFPCPNQP